MREAFILEEGRRIFVIFSLFLRRGVRRDRDEMRGGFSVDRGREGDSFYSPLDGLGKEGKRKEGSSGDAPGTYGWLVAGSTYSSSTASVFPLNVKVDGEY